MSETTTSWWTEGNRKLLMVCAALVAFAGVLIAWMAFQPEGLDFLTLVTTVGGGISLITGSGVAGNVLEHREKTKRMNGGGRGGGGGLGAVGVVLLVLLLAMVLSGCAGASDRAATINPGELIPTGQVTMDKYGCATIHITQPVPVAPGWWIESTLYARQIPLDAGGRCRDMALEPESGPGPDVAPPKR